MVPFGVSKQGRVHFCVTGVREWTGKYKKPIATVAFGVPELGRVHFCVSGHFGGPNYFKTSKVCSVLASSKVTGKLRDTRTDVRRNPTKSE